MTRLHGHAQLSRADLLWAFDAVDKTQRVDVAALLGYEKSPITPTQGQIKIADFGAAADGVSVTKQDLALETTENLHPISEKPSYYRVTTRQRDPQAENQASATLDSDLSEWLKNASADYFTKAQTSIPEIHRNPRRYQPLMPWSRLWPFLYRVLGTSNASSKPDLPKLVDQVASGKIINQVPRRQHPAWSELAELLIDINDHNFPYRNDFFYLCDQLKNLRGEQGLDIQFIHDQPGDFVIRYKNQQEVIEPWRLPGAETTLLILSDLGMHAKSRRVLYDWLVFGQQLAIQGCRPTVLMPVAERDVDKRLLKYFDCVVWDGSSRLKPLTGLTEDPKTEQTHQQTLETLLACFFPAVRVDSGLVRAIRQLLPADQFDIGHESALWQHPAVNHVNEQWTWQAASSKNYRQAFIDLIAKLPKAKQEKIIALIGCYHAQLPEELYFEAMAKLLHPQTQKLLPQAVRIATEQFMANLVLTYVEHEQHIGLDLWVKRYLTRHDDPDLRKDDDYAIAFLAYEKTRHNKEAEIVWPADIPPEKILAFISQKLHQQHYLLRQQGENLQLIAAEKIQQQDDDWGEGGVILMHLIFNDSQVMYSTTRTDGQRQQSSLDLNKQNDYRFSFSAGSNHQFQIGSEKLSLEASTRLENLPWVYYRGMSDKQNVYVETVDKNADVYRWYWHPPAWDQALGLLRGLWSAEQTGTLTTPDWATSSGRDQYGLYADIDIQGIALRMRWIEPGTFLMGSPDDEADRYDDETQYEVIFTQGYWLAETTCTQALWQAMMSDNRSRFKGEDRPADRISWDDAQAFIDKANSMKPELKLCLPTEAQWEYACRAGTTTPFYFGDNISSEQVNYNGTRPYAKGKKSKDRGATVAVKSLPANDWGLYEMHGNVWEWCQDWYGPYPEGSQQDPKGPEEGDSRVLRGGSWFNGGRIVRSAFRFHDSPDLRSGDAGFRLACGNYYEVINNAIPFFFHSCDGFRRCATGV